MDPHLPSWASGLGLQVPFCHHVAHLPLKDEPPHAGARCHPGGWRLTMELEFSAPCLHLLAPSQKEQTRRLAGNEEGYEGREALHDAVWPTRWSCGSVRWKMRRLAVGQDDDKHPTPDHQGRTPYGVTKHPVTSQLRICMSPRGQTSILPTVLFPPGEDALDNSLEARGYGCIP